MAKLFLYNGWVILHCISHLLYPFIYLYTLSLFPYFAIINNAARNIGEHISFRVSGFFSLVKYPELAFLDHLFLIFWEAFILFSIVAVPIDIPINRAQVFPFFHIFTYRVPLFKQKAKAHLSESSSVRS